MADDNSVTVSKESPMGKVTGETKSSSGGGRWRRPIIWATLATGIYLLGRMEGEGQFKLVDVVGKLVSSALDFASAAGESARDAVEM